MVRESSVVKRRGFRESMTNEEETVLRSGFLEKKGRLLAGWQRRYFVVCAKPRVPRLARR
jgi:hypothetical protein